MTTTLHTSTLTSLAPSRNRDASPAITSTPTSAGAFELLAAGSTAGLLVTVVLMHLIDQDWFAFAKDPSYVQTGYTLIEVGGLVAAVALLARRHWLTWGAAFAVAAGPLAGFIASRGPGLPGYTDDIGNWFEPLGVASVCVELAVMTVAGLAGWRAWRTRLQR